MVGNRKAYMEGNMVTPVGNMLVNLINRTIVEMRKRNMDRLYLNSMKSFPYLKDNILTSRTEH